MIRLNEIEAFDKALEAEKEFFLLKHSSTCPISQAAHEEYESYSSENEKVPAYYLVVQDDRPLSNHIAEKFEIKHESPQAILFRNGQPVWNASHWKITEKALKAAVENN